LPLHGFRAEKPEVDFMHHRGCLQRVSGPLRLHVVLRQAAEFRINNIKKFTSHLLVPGTQLFEQARNALILSHDTSKSEQADYMPIRYKFAELFGCRIRSKGIRGMEQFNSREFAPFADFFPSPVAGN